MDHIQRKSAADAEEDKRRPFPSEWVDGHAKDKPVDELRVGKKVESSSRRSGLEESSHVNPFLHPVFLGTSQRIDQEDEEQTSVYADMP